MFKPIRKKINEIDRNATEALLQSNRRGILAMNGDNGYPYAIPINYFYDIETHIFCLIYKTVFFRLPDDMARQPEKIINA